MPSTFSAAAPMAAAWAAKSMAEGTDVAGGVEEVVEAGAAGGELEAVDAAEAAVVEEDDDELLAEHDARWRARSSSSCSCRRRASPRPRGRGGPSSRRGRRRSRSPWWRSRIRGGSRWGASARQSLCSSPGRPPEAQTTMASSPTRAVDGADHLHVGGERVALGRGGDGVDGGGPFRLERAGVGEALVAEGGGELFEGEPGVGDERQRVVLVGVVGGDVDRDDAAVGVLEERPGAGGEVLEAGADGEDDVGGLGDGVGGGGAGDADGAEVERVVVGQGGLAGLGLADGDVVLLGEGLERARWPRRRGRRRRR